MSASKVKMRERKLKNQPVSVQYPSSSTQNSRGNGICFIDIGWLVRMFERKAIRVVTHFILCDEGEGGDVGPSDTSAEHAKTPQLPGGWVRGHQKYGGGYNREMPRCITGKAIVRELVF